jgi:beta-lactamase superfamily II metal-dependent hydrolase
MLFTGDIEKLAEDYLVATYGEQLHADILLGNVPEVFLNTI